MDPIQCLQTQFLNMFCPWKYGKITLKSRILYPSYRNFQYSKKQISCLNRTSVSLFFHFGKSELLLKSHLPNLPRKQHKYNPHLNFIVLGIYNIEFPFPQGKQRSSGTEISQVLSTGSGSLSFPLVCFPFVVVLA